MTKILIFGDSIAWGAFDSENGGWAEQIKKDYLKTFKTEEIGVYNLAISGNDTRGVLFSLEKEIEIFNLVEAEEYIFLFSIGSNDLRFINTKDNPFVPLDEFKNNLEQIVKIVKKYSSKIIFTGLLIVNEKLTKPWVENLYWENDDLKKYDQAIEDFCKQHSITFIPLIDLLTTADVPDGLHPNTAGHKKIYARIKDRLQKIILT
ncbi:MAG: GDSL-type esterase/lipase family protein [Candidatus Komeilibacteria bacterium]|nr:GDSL-type esterase/lipase family protein [Candidatus Komeilibacteria bacterium]